MRPLDTQRPERPKSELWHKKYEKCGLSKARDAAWVCTKRPSLPLQRRKKGAIRRDYRRFGIADISLRRSFRIRVLDRFAVRSGGCLIDRAGSEARPWCKKRGNSTRCLVLRSITSLNANQGE